jgi:phasin family protein
MSLPSPEQIIAAHQVNREMSWGLAKVAFDGFQKLVELNLQAGRSILAESHDHVRKPPSADDPQALAALQARLIQPTAEKVQSYSRQIFAIAAAAQTEFAKLAEAQYEAHNHRVQTLVDNIAQRAPVGSEAAVAALKSTINATNGLYKAAQRTSQNAVEVAESNFNTVVATAWKATQHSVEQAS